MFECFRREAEVFKDEINNRDKNTSMQLLTLAAEAFVILLSAFPLTCTILESNDNQTI